MKTNFTNGLYIVKQGNQYYFESNWTNGDPIWTSDVMEAGVYRFKEAAEGMIQKNHLKVKPIMIKSIGAIKKKAIKTKAKVITKKRRRR